MSMHNIKGIIFDYGGTLDTNGVHWFHVFRQAYVKYLPDVTEAQLREAYVYAERYLATHRVIEPEDDFLAMLRKKVKIQITQLPAATSLDVERIAGDCDAHVRSNMEQTRQVLDALPASHPSPLSHRVRHPKVWAGTISLLYESPMTSTSSGNKPSTSMPSVKMRGSGLRTPTTADSITCLK